MTTSTPESPAPVDHVPTEGIAPDAPRRRGFTRPTRIAVVVILIVAVIAGAGFGISYFVNASRYVSTDNAQIDGDKIMINAPTSGWVEEWRIEQGSAVRQNQVVGRIKILNAFAQPLMSIHAPTAGTVAVDNGVVGTYVTTGTQLAVAYNLDRTYVTARVDDTAIRSVRVGQAVDIDVDAYPDARITGHVRTIQAGAAADFSLFPQSNAQGTGTFQKVTQVIPVKIIFDDVSALTGIDLVPGMNVTVHIHKQLSTAP
jgi:multidrug resistance efflux pump